MIGTETLLDISRMHLDRAESEIEIDNQASHKSVLARVYIVREIVLEVLYRRSEDGKSVIGQLFADTDDDSQDFPDMVHDLLYYGDKKLTEEVLLKYRAVVEVLMGYVTSEDMDGFDMIPELDNEDTPEDPIGFVTYETSRKSAVELRDTLLDLLSELRLLSEYADDVIHWTFEQVDSIKKRRREIAIEIIDARESLRYLFGDIHCEAEWSLEEDSEELWILQTFATELGEYTEYFWDMVAEMENFWQSGTGIFFLERLMQMVQQVERFCKSEDYTSLNGPFLAMSESTDEEE